ncbi:MAG: hypothetical protein RMI90_11785, partial [Thermoguttaceae bacterium]|nr:hypothetical protein [Thermoguttaceae bacterium]
RYLAEKQPTPSADRYRAKSFQIAYEQLTALAAEASSPEKALSCNLNRLPRLEHAYFEAEA